MAEKPHSNKVEKAHIHITGMTCTTCAATIEKGLAETHKTPQGSKETAQLPSTPPYQGAQ